MYLLLCALVFVACYAFTIVTTSVGYHRGLAHGAVRLREPYRRFLLGTGMWLTGVDPQVWVVMHRLHHMHSDTPDDPHTPTRKGLFGFFVMLHKQVMGYNDVRLGLLANEERYTSLGRDIPMSYLMRTDQSWLPVLLHLALGILVAVLGGGWLLGVALFTGMMSHIVQGAVINYFGHAHGSRNFDSTDDSRNNHLAAWLVLGEGFQNNHHRWPASARFSFRRREVDMGWGACLVLEKLGVLTVSRATLMPRERTLRATQAPRVPSELAVAIPR